MNKPFRLDHHALAAAPKFTELAHHLSAWSAIDSGVTFNEYCRAACRFWAQIFADGEQKRSAPFADLLGRIERREEHTILTNWGGVVVTLHEPPRVEKFLVIRQGGYLALEKHAEKDERLEVQEGAGLLLWRAAADQALAVVPLALGDEFHFEPGREHCLIGTADLLVFERSTDPKGMDQDLIFIYEPDGAAG